MKGFPRWVYPYLLYGLVFAWYMTNVATPGLSLFGHDFRHDELWGWRAWIPLAVIAVVAAVITRFSPRPLRGLVAGMWCDWTRVSFGLFGLLPFVALIAFDEVEHTYCFPLLVVVELILLVGAVAYMRATTSRRRVAALLASAVVAVVVTAVGSGVYWQAHDIVGGRVVFAEANLRLVQLVPGVLAQLAVVVVVLFAPAVLGVVRRAAGVVGVG